MAEQKDHKNDGKAGKKVGQPKEREMSRDEMDGHVARLNQLITKFQKAQDEARAQGQFVELRPLLRCSACGLCEDVLFSGKHVTYWASEEEDSGLRFAEIESGYFICPNCGFLIHLPADQVEDL